MTAIILAKLAPYIIGAIAIFATSFGLRRSGKNAAKAEAAAKSAKAETTRVRIDDAIDQDSDLVDRARSAGIVRKP